MSNNSNLLVEEKMENQNHRQSAAIKAIQKIALKWPSEIVARSQIGKFSGGLVAPGTAANEDCAGSGIPGAFRIGRQIAYPVQSVIDWLISRLTEV